MDAQTTVVYPFDGVPEAGETREVAPGVHWLRMPLPFKLDHINLWLLEDGEGWTIVDTGINSELTRDIWERLFAGPMGGKPVTRVICTHFHPDHMGLAGWLTTRWGVPLSATLAEWLMGRMLWLDTDHDAVVKVQHAFYRRAGLDGDRLESLAGRGNQYVRGVSEIPHSFQRLRDGDMVDIGGRGWRVIVGHGHSVEHACLYCAETGVLISGDQVLPRISPNVSVWPNQPDADPLTLFLNSLAAFKGLPASTLVLPSHDAPFHGCTPGWSSWRGIMTTASPRSRPPVRGKPSSAADLLPVLFSRELDLQQMSFAVGEVLAHLHYLAARGRLARVMGDDGVERFHTPD